MHVERFINELMPSNCYLVVDDESKHCICIDPASEKSEREIDFIESKGLTLDYIILTHEHTDHTWGVNALIDRYPSVKVVCSELCKQALDKESKVYFQLIYDNADYAYNVRRVDLTTEELGWHMGWVGYGVHFINTPGHSPGSICIVIDGTIFGGDTLMPFKPVIRKRAGGNKEQFQASVNKILNTFPSDTLVYPGHGELGMIKDIKEIITSK
jgi:glyoxylase-like metal-dependent hydrolase (beta-lactamase superfamily II)